MQSALCNISDKLHTSHTRRGKRSQFQDVEKEGCPIKLLSDLNFYLLADVLVGLPVFLFLFSLHSKTRHFDMYFKDVAHTPSWVVMHSGGKARGSVP